MNDPIVEVGDLYITSYPSTIIAYNNDDIYRSEFRMKENYMFVILEKNIVALGTEHARILMQNTGKLQIIEMSELIGYIIRKMIKKIG